MSDINVQQLRLENIAEQCAKESTQFFQRLSYDPRYCFELLRRALEERNHLAWQFVYRQYEALVLSWVVRHSAFATSGEEVDHFVNGAFEKFWLAIPPERFQNFTDLKALLRYLQMCVHSVISDHTRQAEQRMLSTQPLLIDGITNQPDIATSIVDQAQGDALWQWIDARLHNERERQVIYASFVLSLKPREVYQQFPDHFRDVSEVYRVKENVLERLRRDPELRRLFGENA